MVFQQKLLAWLVEQWSGRPALTNGRRPKPLVKSVREPAPKSLFWAPHLCTRIWIGAMIGLLKMPLSICQSGWREIRNTLPVNRWVRLSTDHITLRKDYQRVDTAYLWVVAITFVFFHKLYRKLESKRKITEHHHHHHHHHHHQQQQLY